MRRLCLAAAKQQLLKQPVSHHSLPTRTIVCRQFCIAPLRLLSPAAIMLQSATTSVLCVLLIALLAPMTHANSVGKVRWSACCVQVHLPQCLLCTALHSLFVPSLRTSPEHDLASAAVLLFGHRLHLRVKLLVCRDGHGRCDVRSSSQRRRLLWSVHPSEPNGRWCPVVHSSADWSGQGYQRYKLGCPSQLWGSVQNILEVH